MNHHLVVIRSRCGLLTATRQIALRNRYQRICLPCEQRVFIICNAIPLLVRRRDLTVSLPVVPTDTGC